MATGSVDGSPSPTVLDKLNLTWLLRLFRSTIGQKFIMGLTGLGLCGFLVVHLAGNMLLYSGKGAFDEYAHKLHSQEWLPLAEAGLFLLFLLHIYLAFVTSAENRRARQHGYALKESKRTDRVLSPAPSSWMFVSGAVVLCFLILHITDMKLGLRKDIAYSPGEHEAFLNTFAVLSNPFSQVVYIAGTIVLGFHLSHGFSSAFNSLGLVHPKYSPFIKVFGIVFAVVIAAGFCSLPIIVPRSPALMKQWTDARATLESTTAPPEAAVP